MYEESNHPKDSSSTGINRAEFLKRGAVAGISVTALGPVLAACGGGSSSTGSSAGTAGTAVALDRAPTAPFKPNLPAGAKPDLPRRIGFPLPGGAELYTELDDSVRAAAEEHDIEYLSAQANNDSTQQYQQAQQLLSRGLGALVVFDLAPPTMEPLQLEAIEEGAAVLCGPDAMSTCQLTADQGRVGEVQAEAAIKYAEEHLGGKAQVALFNQDTIPSQKIRADGVRSTLAAAGPGIKLAADVTADGAEASKGAELTRTAIQKNPNINLWIGSDAVLVGAQSALEEAGYTDEKTALFGVDGEERALESIVDGTIFRSTQAFTYSTVAYGWGAYTADWFDGKSIPMVLSVEPLELNSPETVSAFKAVNADPAKAYAENVKTSKYFKLLGNTSFEENRYLTVLA